MVAFGKENVSGVNGCDLFVCHNSLDQASQAAKAKHPRANVKFQQEFSIKEGLAMESAPYELVDFG